MVVRIESADEARIAYAAGYSGKAEPAGLSPGGRGAFALGKDDYDNGRPKTGNAQIEKAAHKAESEAKGSGGVNHRAVNDEVARAKAQRRKDVAADKPKKKAPEPATAHTDDDGGSRGSGNDGGGGSTPPEARRPLFTGKLSTWGDGGGLLMAVFLYPIALAGLTRGPSGITAWLNAKFFNKVATPPAKLNTSAIGSAVGAAAAGLPPIVVGGVVLGNVAAGTAGSK